ncbi:glycoside hydrolase, partial [bacterium]
LLAQGLARGKSSDLEVRNTTSWPRTDLVLLAAGRSKAGDRVEDDQGRPMPSQRLRTGELAVLVRDVPPLGAKRLRVRKGAAFVGERAHAEGNRLWNDDYRVALDPKTGAIASLRSVRLGKELVQKPLNAFLYLSGKELGGVQANGRPRFEVVEPGPLVARIRARSSASGAKGLTQEITLVAGIDRVDVSDVIDKLPVRAKEGVHFAFPLNVLDGEVRVDLPWATIRPEGDQIAGANKNWLTTQGYVDVSNKAFGVTWISLDAPLIEVGEISANLLGSVTDPAEWRARIAPTQTFYSWALNNHWHTNYRAEQEGRLTFRYAIQAHGPYEPAAASRLGMAARQPLLVATASPPAESLLTLSEPSVVATRVVPSDDGKALIVRLWGATEGTKRVRLRWRTGLG